MKERKNGNRRFGPAKTPAFPWSHELGDLRPDFVAQMLLRKRRLKAGSCRTSTGPCTTADRNSIIGRRKGALMSAMSWKAAAKADLAGCPSWAINRPGSPEIELPLYTRKRTQVGRRLRSGSCRFCCRSPLKAAANNDSLTLARSAAGMGHDGSVGAGSRAAVLFILP
jgi:hypothetical protein